MHNNHNRMKIQFLMATIQEEKVQVKRRDLPVLISADKINHYLL